MTRQLDYWIRHELINLSLQSIFNNQDILIWYLMKYSVVLNTNNCIQQ